MAPRCIRRGFGQPISERQAIDGGQREQHSEQPELHQRNERGHSPGRQPRHVAASIRHLHLAAPPSTSTADRPTGVKLRQAVAAALWGSVPRVINRGRYRQARRRRR